ncbi:DUF6894 family protein [Devosia enhydra]|uniref:DUF6894 family protein n=1 Tax=Devosia enhydra TaxID=665118 RepID=UPI003CC7D718
MSRYYFKFSAPEDSTFEEVEVELADDAMARHEAVQTLTAICSESGRVPTRQSLEVRKQDRTLVLCLSLSLSESGSAGC